MIITVTPNPALDRMFQVGHLLVGEVNRATATQVDAGGKGINISRALHAQGIPSVAIFPMAGAAGAELVTALNQLGIENHPVATSGETRTNITVTDDAGITTKINAPGSVLLPDDETNLLTAVRSVASSWLAAHSAPNSGRQNQTEPLIIVGAGSFPTGTDPDFYMKLAVLGNELGAQVAIDSSGESLSRAVKAGGLAIVKPNESELAELAGRPLRTVSDVVMAAREIIAYGNEAVLVSLGENGAMLVTAQSVTWAGGPALVPVSTVGAGDTMLAGYLVSRSGSLTAAPETIKKLQFTTPNNPPSTPPQQRTSPELRALKAAVAWGRAAVLQPGTAVPSAAQLRPEEVHVINDPEPSLHLSELTNFYC